MSTGFGALVKIDMVVHFLNILELIHVYFRHQHCKLTWILFVFN